MLDFNPDYVERNNINNQLTYGELGLATHEVIFDFQAPLWPVLEGWRVAVWRFNKSRVYQVRRKVFDRLCQLVASMPGACVSDHPLGRTVGFNSKGV